MPRLPVLKPRDVSRALEALGFVEIRQCGLRKQFRHADGRGTNVPVHGARDIPPFLLRQIIKDIRVTPEESLERLRQNPPS